jgi:hypothetical protein
MTAGHCHTQAQTSCHTCVYRNSDLSKTPQTQPLLPLLIIVLRFKAPIINASPFSSAFSDADLSKALQRTLSLIVSNAERTYNPAHFTSWSPALDDLSAAVILTTEAKENTTPSSAIFTPLKPYLDAPPSLTNVILDHSIQSLAATSSEPSIPLDIILLRSPNSSIAIEIGKKFGWEPRRSSLAWSINQGRASGFPVLGDLIKDFWAWAEWTSDDVSNGAVRGDDRTQGSLTLVDGTIRERETEGSLTLNDATSRNGARYSQETLVMMFQWSTVADGERFKNPQSKSYGADRLLLPKDLWDKRVAQPVKQLRETGAKVETFRVELRGVDFTDEKTRGRRSRTLSSIASGFGGKVSGFLK